MQEYNEYDEQGEKPWWSCGKNGLEPDNYGPAVETPKGEKPWWSNAKNGIKKEETKED